MERTPSAKVGTRAGGTQVVVLGLEVAQPGRAFPAPRGLASRRLASKLGRRTSGRPAHPVPLCHPFPTPFVEHSVSRRGVRAVSNGGIPEIGARSLSDGDSTPSPHVGGGEAGAGATLRCGGGRSPRCGGSAEAGWRRRPVPSLNLRRPRPGRAGGCAAGQAPLAPPRRPPGVLPRCPLGEWGTASGGRRGQRERPQVREGALEAPEARAVGGAEFEPLVLRPPRDPGCPALLLTRGPLFTWRPPPLQSSPSIGQVCRWVLTHRRLEGARGPQGQWTLRAGIDPANGRDSGAPDRHVSYRRWASLEGALLLWEVL